LNQALFERINVHEDAELEAELSQPFETSTK
jgi:hypothetical protein